MVAGKIASSVVAAASSSSAPPLTTTTTVLSEVMAALTINMTATTTAVAAVAAAASERSGPCCHGSTSAHFPDGRAYSDVIKKYEDREGAAKYYKDDAENFTDSNFSQYIVAVCTSWYLKTNTTNEAMKGLLLLAMLGKYPSDPEAKGVFDDKFIRYTRSLKHKDDRSVINCLSRETKAFCDCMQAKKTEAKGMAKTELCCGCDITFPRTSQHYIS